MDIKSAFPSGDFIKAGDLQGREHVVIIDRIETREFQDGSTKPCLRFEAKELLGLNRTNARVLIAAYRSSNSDDWIGRSLVIYPTETDFQGKRVPCIGGRVAGRSPRRRPPNVRRCRRRRTMLLSAARFSRMKYRSDDAPGDLKCLFRASQGTGGPLIHAKPRNSIGGVAQRLPRIRDRLGRGKMAKSCRERVRRWRARQARGERVISITIKEAETVDSLISVGRLENPVAGDDLAAISDALSSLVDDWTLDEQETHY